MATRTPLAYIGAIVKQIPAGDTIPSAILPDVVAAATVGDATHIPVVTYDAKGRITGTTTATITTGKQRTFAYWVA